MTGTPAARGFAAASAAFILWGLFPLYLHALAAVPVVQVIAHRITWSCLFIMAWLLWRGELGRLSAPLASGQLLARLALTALLVSWQLAGVRVERRRTSTSSTRASATTSTRSSTYCWASCVLHERLNVAQWTAVTLAAAAVGYLAVLGGHPPWIAGVLAVSFSLYGLLRKMISVDALPGLAIETLLLMPLAVAYLGWCQASGSRRAQQRRPGHRGAADRQRTAHRDSAVPVRLRGARPALLDRRCAAVHRPEPAAAVRGARVPRELRAGAPAGFALHLGGRC